MSIWDSAITNNYNVDFAQHRVEHFLTVNLLELGIAPMVFK